MSGKSNSGKILVISLAILFAIAVYYSTTTISSNTDFSSPFSFTKSTDKLSILVVGDMMLDRNVRNLINKNGFDEFFSGVKELVSGADIAIANLEGPFTPYPSLTASLVNKTLTFTFDPALAPKLSDLGFDILGLANNHTLNFGREGLEMTREYIREAGMFYYGDPNNATELSLITAENGISVGFVGFHEFTYVNFTKVLEEIDYLRVQVDVVIVTPHWGEEYQKAPTENMKKWAHEFIDHGADAVIGAHTHVVGDIEEYKGKKIFYSLGNFAFDQYFSIATMNGLGVLMGVEKDKEGKLAIKYDLIPIRTDRKGVSVVDNP